MPPVNVFLTTNIIRFHLKSPADPAAPLNGGKKTSAQGSVPLISSLFFLSSFLCFLLLRFNYFSNTVRESVLTHLNPGAVKG